MMNLGSLSFFFSAPRPVMVRWQQINLVAAGEQGILNEILAVTYLKDLRKRRKSKQNHNSKSISGSVAFCTARRTLKSSARNKLYAQIHKMG